MRELFCVRCLGLVASERGRQIAVTAEALVRWGYAFDELQGSGEVSHAGVCRLAREVNRFGARSAKLALLPDEPAGGYSFFILLPEGAYDAARTRRASIVRPCRAEIATAVSAKLDMVDRVGARRSYGLYVRSNVYNRGSLS